MREEVQVSLLEACTACTPQLSYAQVQVLLRVKPLRKSARVRAVILLAIWGLFLMVLLCRP